MGICVPIYGDIYTKLYEIEWEWLENQLSMAFYGDLGDGLLLLYPYYHESGICEPTEVHMDLYGSYDRNSLQIPMINKVVYRIHVYRSI